MLLRLYPARFRERFGEGMAQTFRDLCRERREAKRSVLALAVWVFVETSVGILRENTMHMPELVKTMLRVALGALVLLMAPLVASQFVEGWNWPPMTFLRVYGLFFVVGMAFALITKRVGVWSYKAGVGVALFGGFALAWSTMVQTADSGHPENLWLFSVLAVGALGALVARLKARGLAWTLFAMAGTLALVAVIVPTFGEPDQALRMATGRAVFVALFVASGLMFRHASVAGAK